MELQHLFHHGKAQTVALRGVAGVALIELFKDVRLRVGAHPLALMINARLLILLEAGNWIVAVTTEGGMSL